MKTRFRVRSALVAAALLAAAPVLAACDTQQGPAERMGERIDNAAEDMGDAMKALSGEDDDDWWE